MDSITQQRLAPCHPALRAKVSAAIDACARQGIYVRVNSGLRTYAEQDALFFSCHHPDGTLDRSKPWKTNARGGYSNHNFGMAVDAVPSLQGMNAPYAPCWTVNHPAFQAMVRAMKAQGLAWGGEWTTPDSDHFQLADVEVTPTAANRAEYARGGLAAVWACYRDQVAASGAVAA